MSNFDLGPLTRESRRPRWVREHPRAPWAAVGAVCLGAFMGQLDASIVTLTYPQLESEFHAGLGSVQWVSLSYLVVLAVLLVPVGRWADTRGRKLLYLYGFGLFCLASAACARAPSLGWLVAGRGLQAVGAALLQANSVALVVLSVPVEDRARFSGGRPGTGPGPGSHPRWGAGGCLRVAVGVLGKRPDWRRCDLGWVSSPAAQPGP
jgi:MFS family permease